MNCAVHNRKNLIFSHPTRSPRPPRLFPHTPLSKRGACIWNSRQELAAVQQTIWPSTAELFANAHPDAPCTRSNYMVSCRGNSYIIEYWFMDKIIFSAPVASLPLSFALISRMTWRGNMQSKSRSRACGDFYRAFWISATLPQIKFERVCEYSFICASLGFFFFLQIYKWFLLTLNQWFYTLPTGVP